MSTWLCCFSTTAPQHWSFIPPLVDWMMNTSFYNHKSILHSTVDLWDISADPHFKSTHTPTRHCRRAHTCTGRAVCHIFFIFLLVCLGCSGSTHRSNANTLPRTFAEIVCMQKHSGVPPDSTRCEWHPTSTKVISDSSSAWLLTDQPD